MPPTPRRRSLRDAALAASVGHWVDEVERALDGHLDQGRSLEEESADVVRDALEALVRKKLSDKVVFVETGLFPIEKGDMAAEVPHDTFPDELPRSARKAPEEHGTLEEDLSGLSEADRITLEGILRELEKGSLRNLSEERIQGWAIIRGIRDAHPAESTFAFSRDILGYDLRAFFERSSARLRTEVEKVLSKLLSAEGS